jgi:hypothetical protein
MLEQATRESAGNCTAQLVLHAYPGAAGPGRASVCAAQISQPAQSAAALVEQQDPKLGPVQAKDRGQTTQFTAQAAPAALESAVKAAFPNAPIVSCGATVTAFQGSGDWGQIAEQWGLRRRQGWQAVAQTAGPDQAPGQGAGGPVAAGVDHCLVHDSSSTMVGSAGTWLAVVRREAGESRPVIIAETPDMVALASDYSYLAPLPGIELARVFRPAADVAYVWDRSSQAAREHQLARSGSAA